MRLSFRHLLSQNLQQTDVENGRCVFTVKNEPLHNYGNYCTITSKEKNTNIKSNKNRHPHTKIDTIVQVQI